MIVNVSAVVLLAIVALVLIKKYELKAGHAVVCAARVLPGKFSDGRRHQPYHRKSRHPAWRREVLMPYLLPPTARPF